MVCAINNDTNNDRHSCSSIELQEITFSQYLENPTVYYFGITNTIDLNDTTDREHLFNMFKIEYIDPHESIQFERNICRTRNYQTNDVNHEITFTFKLIDNNISVENEYDTRNVISKKVLTYIVNNDGNDNYNRHFNYYPEQ